MIDLTDPELRELCRRPWLMTLFICQSVCLFIYACVVVTVCIPWIIGAVIWNRWIIEWTSKMIILLVVMQSVIGCVSLHHHHKELRRYFIAGILEGKERCAREQAKRD